MGDDLRLAAEVLQIGDNAQVGDDAIVILIGILILVFLLTFTLPHLIFPFLSLGLLAKLYIAICTPIFGIFIFRNILSLEL